ncbi:MAG TPA: hypothetical protein PLV52_06850, partial [Candidatus Omnitrophota bacterium]|nr:hypothetical protein [Candidatus Omnitrophota bacterium]
EATTKQSLNDKEIASASPAAYGGKAQPRNDSVVIHIQDAHCNYAAQHRIADIVGYLNKEFGVNKVNLEGGAGNYDLSVFTSIADKDIRRKVSDYFVEEGLLSGAEYFASNNTGKVVLHGLEDPKLYMANLNIYRESLKNKDEIDRALKSLSLTLNSLKPKIYSPSLLEFDMKYSSYKANNMEFKDYLSYLVSKARERAIDMSGFKNIILLNQSLDLESGIDFKRANTEREKLIDALQKNLSQKELEEMVVKTVDYRAEKISQKDFYSYLTKKARSAGEGLSAYPELQKFVIYISTYDAIEKSGIMDEVSLLEDKVKVSLYENDTQKSLSDLSKDLTLLKNIFNISITKDDYGYYAKNKNAFDMRNYKDFIDKEAPKYKVESGINGDIANLDKYRGQIEKFYDYSFKRDEVFVKNLRLAVSGERLGARGKDKPITDNRTPNTAIVITGGFHTENLCELFKK